MGQSIPSYSELMLPTIRAVLDLGGSGAAREITESVIEREGFPEELIAMTYEGREKSVLIDRLDWARSYSKLGGALESPKRGLFLITDVGREIAALPDHEANERLKKIDHDVRAARPKKEGAKTRSPQTNVPDSPLEDETWREVLLTRLHQLSDDGFEHFALYLLRAHGMEMRWTGGSGDEGIDGIGTAPIGRILTRTVAVQAKKYEPSRTVGRNEVALFQADATAAGAEHGVFVTTARFSGPARDAALTRQPTIDLVDGEKLTALCLDAEVGVNLNPLVMEDFFDRFDDPQVSRR